MTNIVVDKLDIDDWFKKLPEKIDVILSDPPYPFDERNGAGRYQNMYSRFDWAKIGDIFKQMYDHSNDGARAYIFCNRDGLRQTEDLLIAAGWTFRNLLVWDKIKIGMGYHHRNQTEYILYVTKGKPKVYITGRSNLFSYKKPGKKDINLAIGYDPSECLSAKPWQIWQDILTHAALDSEVIADPFAGSNPMKAALDLTPTLLAKIKTAYTNVYVT